MSRRTIETKQDTNILDSVVDSYAAHKDTEKLLKKELASESDIIKSIFKEQELTEYATTKYTAKVSYTENSKINEQNCIEILREHLDEIAFANIVKQKEYLDEEALEAAIYNNPTLGEVVAKAIETKESTVRLTITKNKGAK